MGRHLPCGEINETQPSWPANGCPGENWFDSKPEQKKIAQANDPVTKRDPVAVRRDMFIGVAPSNQTDAADRTIRIALHPGNRQACGGMTRRRKVFDSPEIRAAWYRVADWPLRVQLRELRLPPRAPTPRGGAVTQRRDYRVIVVTTLLVTRGRFVLVDQLRACACTLSPRNAVSLVTEKLASAIGSTPVDGTLAAPARMNPLLGKLEYHRCRHYLSAHLGCPRVPVDAEVAVPADVVTAGCQDLSVLADRHALQRAQQDRAARTGAAAAPSSRASVANALCSPPERVLRWGSPSYDESVAPTTP